jgi:tetratricopeptide (TPR) repeat protein
VPRAPSEFIRDSRQALELAQRELERGHIQDAIDVLERVLETCEESGPVHTLLGIAYARSHQVGRAFEQLERAMTLDPGAFGPRCALGELYLRLCVVEQGRARLAEALEYATTREERAYVQQLLREDRARDRKRAQRPSFGTSVWGWWRRGKT